MVSSPSVRTVLVLLIVVGALGSAASHGTHGLWVDSHSGSGSFVAADNFQNNAGGPTADAGGPYEVYEGEIMQLDGTGSDTQTGSSDYTWEILNGPGELSDSSGSTPDYVAPTEVQSDAIVQVNLTIKDKGEIDTDETTITVLDTGSGNQPPIASFTYDRNGEGSSPNVDLDAGGSSDDGGIDEYGWDIDGDGEFEEYGVELTKMKISEGTEVTLRVTDNDGKTDTVTKTV